LPGVPEVCRSECSGSECSGTECSGFTSYKNAKEAERKAERGGEERERGGEEGRKRRRGRQSGGAYRKAGIALLHEIYYV
jgi:hypothetical protein